MQEFLLEGDTTYDIDMLNPSLTDLQLQGMKDRDNTEGKWVYQALLVQASADIYYWYWQTGLKADRKEKGI